MPRQESTAGSALALIRLLAQRLTTNEDARNFLTMDYTKYITIEPGKRSGKPCVRGMRITVYDVLDYLASGMSEDEILDDFPELTRDDIRACLAFVADGERRVMSIPV